MCEIGLKETRSLSSLYEWWYDPPRVCLNENIGKNLLFTFSKDLVSVSLFLPSAWKAR